jgi:nicotinamide-nucleotide amidase
MAEQDLIEPARALLDLCRAKALTIAAAESCTGGLLAATLTEIPGSSDVFDRGFVTYSNDAKTAMLGVPAELIATFGAVSRETAQAMASGALERDLAVAITGIAGPGGAMPGKPVGLVHLAAASRGGRRSHQLREFGAIGRAGVRRCAVHEALALLRELAEQEMPSTSSR